MRWMTGQKTSTATINKTVPMISALMLSSLFLLVVRVDGTSMLVPGRPAFRDQ